MVLEPWADSRYPQWHMDYFILKSPEKQQQCEELSDCSVPLKAANKSVTDALHLLKD